MELNLEGILETVLVGTVASLFLLSALFLFFGHVLRVDTIRRIAKLVLYETEVEQLEEHSPAGTEGGGTDIEGDHGSNRAVERAEKAEKKDEKHLTFAFLLMIAVLYGLGGAVEAMTHDISLYNDKSIKTTAFEKVARGRVQGRAASPDFARFVIDHAACKAAGRKLMIGYRCHFEAYNLEAMRLARSGAVGHTRYVRSEHGFVQRNPSEWRLKRALAGGGCSSWAWAGARATPRTP